MPQSVTAFVSDLIFSTKITSTARALDVDVQVVRTVDQLNQRLAGGAQRLLLVDLNASGDDPIEAVRAARSIPQPPHIVCYLSHVQTELAEQARQAGADEVMPRSAFVVRLPDLLRR